jgi:Transposase DDE domain
MFEVKLISLYFYICEMYEEKLKYQCERFSNNDQPEFTDQEILTIYLFVTSQEKRSKIKEVHHFANSYLHSWFPKLPSYQAFNARLNRLVNVLEQLSIELMEQYLPSDCSETLSLLDSMPIITCSGKRQGKVARDITAKGYCSTKGMYYYGLKLHALGWKRKGTLPWPESIVLTSAAENDLTVFKENWSKIDNRIFHGDKIYNNSDWFKNLLEQYNSEMLTPVKGIKGMPQCIKQWDKAANDLYSTAVSRIRQPIESFFNWLIEKTDIQRASKIRSTQGLLVHVFGKLAATFLFVIFNP